MKSNRRGNRRKLQALGLAGMLLLQPVQSVMAAPIQEEVITVPEEAEPISEEYQVMPPLTYHEIEGEEAVGSVLDDPDYAGPDYAVIESRFSPLDAETRDLPPIRNQNPYGTCWAFSSLGMGEAGQYVKKGETVDLSELHLAYFAYHTVNDPLGGLDGDSNTAIGATFMDRGGNLGLSFKVLASWTGAAAEETAPYYTAYETLYNGLDTSLAFTDLLHLQGAYMINIDTDADIVKQKIKENGGVGTSYYAATSYVELPQYYNSAKAAYYVPTVKGTNHAIMLVGWDDTFAAENFVTPPEGNGAWLIRNSWGGSSNSYDYNSYFWISYYDQTLSNVAYAFEYEAADNYDNNYQYDGAMQDCYIGYNNQAKMANVYTAKAEGEGKEVLKAVGFYTGNVNVDYKIEIYKNLVDAFNPESGTLVPAATTTGTTMMEGYYTVPLNSEVDLKKGTSFAVVITLYKAGTSVTVVMEAPISGSWYACTAAAQEGQSFTYNGSWFDIGTAWNRNIRIKAFTDSVYEESKPITSIDLNTYQKEIIKGESFKLNARVEPADTTETVLWRSSDAEVALVDNEGMVTGLKTGTAVITAAAEDVSANCTIEVKAPPIESIILSSSQLTLKTGDIAVLDAIIIPEDTEDTLSWSSSDSTVASVDHTGKITAKKTGTTVITAAAGKVKAQCLVTVEQKKVPAASIQLNVTDAEMMLGEGMQLEAVIRPAATTDTITWKSSDERVVSVDADGRLKAWESGDAVITASAGTQSAACKVTVKFPFSDVPVVKGNWKYESVCYVYASGIMNGITGTDWFKPDAPLTRSMFATVLYRMAGNPAADYSDRFTDVIPDKWYSNAIIWANNQGIVKGFEDGSYGIDTDITREQIAKMLYEYARTEGYNLNASASLDAYTDAGEVNTWAEGYIKWAVGVGMINGKPNEGGGYRLDPKGKATRGECAAMLMRFQDRYNN